MSPQRCGAQLKLEPGGYATCERYVDGHFSLDHKDFSIGVQWPCCSKHCLKDHAHGRYRLRMGGASGPGTLDGRAPKKSKPPRPRRHACSICLAVAELDGDRCKDWEACQERAPALFGTDSAS